MYCKLFLTFHPLCHAFQFFWRLWSPYSLHFRVRAAANATGRCVHPTHVRLEPPAQPLKKDCVRISTTNDKTSVRHSVAVAGGTKQAIFFGVTVGAWFGVLAFCVGDSPSGGEFLPGNQFPALFQEFFVIVPILYRPGRSLDPLKKLLVFFGDTGNSKHIVAGCVCVLDAGFFWCFLLLDFAVTAFDAVFVFIPPSLFVGDRVLVFLFAFVVFVVMIVVVSGLVALFVQPAFVFGAGYAFRRL